MSRRRNKRWLCGVRGDCVNLNYSRLSMAQGEDICAQRAIRRFKSNAITIADEESIIDAGLIFFFQAEDGIRDLTVTGVQTCALPICRLDKGGRVAGGPRAAARPFVDWLAEAVAQRATSWRQLAAEAGVSHAALSALRT